MSVLVTFLRIAHLAKVAARGRARMWGLSQPDAKPKNAGERVLSLLKLSPSTKLERIYLPSELQYDVDARHAKMMYTVRLPGADSGYTSCAYVQFTTAGAVKVIGIESCAFTKDGSGEVSLVSAQACIMQLLADVSKLLLLADMMRHPVAYLMTRSTPSTPPTPSTDLRLTIQGGVDEKLFSALFKTNIMQTSEKDLRGLPSKICSETAACIDDGFMGFNGHDVDEPTKAYTVFWKAPPVKLVC